MVHAALLLLMLEAADADLVSTISLKRRTPNLQLSTRRTADYPIYWHRCPNTVVGQNVRKSFRDSSRTRVSWNVGSPACLAHVRLPHARPAAASRGLRQAPRR